MKGFGIKLRDTLLQILCSLIAIPLFLFFILNYIFYSPFERYRFRRSPVGSSGEKYRFLVTKSLPFRIKEILLSLGREAISDEDDIFEYVLGGDITVVCYQFTVAEHMRNENGDVIFPTDNDDAGFGFINISKAVRELEERCGCRAVLCTEEEFDEQSDGYRCLSGVAPCVHISSLRDFVANGI